MEQIMICLTTRELEITSSFGIETETFKFGAGKLVYLPESLAEELSKSGDVAVVRALEHKPGDPLSDSHAADRLLRRFDMVGRHDGCDDHFVCCNAGVFVCGTPTRSY